MSRNRNYLIVELHRPEPVAIVRSVRGHFLPNNVKRKPSSEADGHLA